MNGAGKGKSCSGEGDLLLLLLFAEKMSEGSRKDIEWETALLRWQLMVVLCPVVGRISFDKYVATR